MNDQVLCRYENVDIEVPENTIRILSAGYNSSALVTEDGKVYLWGQINYTHTGFRRLDEINSKQVITQLACGIDHFIALTDKQIVITWGKGIALGINFYIDSKQNNLTIT